MSETDLYLNELFQSFQSSFAGGELDMAKLEIERLSRHNQSCQKQYDMVKKQLYDKKMLLSKVQLKYNLVKAERDLLEREVASSKSFQEMSDKYNYFYQFIPHQGPESPKLVMEEKVDTQDTDSKYTQDHHSMNMVFSDLMRSLPDTVGNASCSQKLVKMIRHFFSRMKFINISKRQNMLRRSRKEFFSKHSFKYNRIYDDYDSITAKSDDIITLDGSNSSQDVVAELLKRDKQQKVYIKDLHDCIESQNRTIAQLRYDIVHLVSTYISDPQTYTHDHNPTSSHSTQYYVFSETCSF